MFFMGKTASMRIGLSNDGWSRWWNGILGKFVQYFSISFKNLIAARYLMHAVRLKEIFPRCVPPPPPQSV